MSENFFVSQFEGLTDRFARPHVEPDVRHPYTKAMVQGCFAAIGGDGQSRITRNCRIYVAGSQIGPFASKTVIRRIAEAEDLDSIDWTEIFGGEDFLIFINHAALYSRSMLSASKSFVGDFDRRFGQSGISIEHHVIAGRYAETSFGVHIDDATDRLFHFNLGPNEKSMELWPREEFLGRYDGDIARPRRTVTHAEPATFQIPAGSSFFLPANYHHVGSSTRGVSVVVALALSRQSESLLLQAATQELRNLVPPKRRWADYYEDFVAMESGDFGALDHFDRVGLAEAHRHAVARRLSNNSFAEIPDISISRPGRAAGRYALARPAIQIVDTPRGAFVYSGGHRAILRTESQIRDIDGIVKMGEFDISPSSGLDAEALAFRCWLVATGGATPVVEPALSPA